MVVYYLKLYSHPYEDVVPHYAVTTSVENPIDDYDPITAKGQFEQLWLVPGTEENT
jgi:hypothetical protein